MPRRLGCVIGLAGGIASGKSHVAAAFQRCGAAVLSADAIAHRLLETDDIQAAIRERFGSELFRDDGTVDRRRLASIVFAPTASPEPLAFLESLIHPRVTWEIQRRLAAIAAEVPSPPLIVIDAPLLFEAGVVGLVDEVVFVETPDEVRWERCRKRGWERDDFIARESRQWSLSRKRLAADVVIDGTLDPDALEATLRAMEILAQHQ